MAYQRKRPQSPLSRVKGVSLRVTAQQYEILSKFAKKEKTTVAKVIDKALSQYLGGDWSNEPENEAE